MTFPLTITIISTGEVLQYVADKPRRYAVDLYEIKQLIWSHPKISRSEVNLWTEADKALVKIPIDRIEEAQKLLDHLNSRKRVKRKERLIPEQYTRYRNAKYEYEKIKFVNWIRDGHFIEPDNPEVGTSNGLTNFILEYLLWTGHFANRTGNEGRVIIDKQGKPKRIPSSSKNGMQDIDCNLKHPQHQFGIPWKIEIKINRDTHKDNQIEYGVKVASTGGVYSVVRNVDDFFGQLDKLLILQPIQTTLL